MHVCCVNACLCPDCLCCVASNASLSPLDFQVSRREVLAAVVTFFVCELVFVLVPHMLSCWMRS